jgi:hypothetical protein
MDSLASVPGLLSRIAGYAANVPGTLGQVPVQFRVASTASNATYPFSNKCLYVLRMNVCLVVRVTNALSNPIFPTV